jgi:hypothetical protein
VFCIDFYVRDFKRRPNYLEMKEVFDVKPGIPKLKTVRRWCWWCNTEHGEADTSVKSAFEGLFIRVVVPGWLAFDNGWRIGLQRNDDNRRTMVIENGEDPVYGDEFSDGKGGATHLVYACDDCSVYNCCFGKVFYGYCVSSLNTEPPNARTLIV